jgi:hypothetical protein
MNLCIFIYNGMILRLVSRGRRSVPFSARLLLILLSDIDISYLSTLCTFWYSWSQILNDDNHHHFPYMRFDRVLCRSGTGNVFQYWSWYVTHILSDVHARGPARQTTWAKARFCICSDDLKPKHTLGEYGPDVLHFLWNLTDRCVRHHFGFHPNEHGQDLMSQFTDHDRGFKFRSLRLTVWGKLLNDYRTRFKFYFE